MNGPPKLVPHPYVDVVSFCSFVLLQTNSSSLRRCGLLLQFCFATNKFGLVFGNTANNPVRGAVWSPDKLRATYPVRLRGVEIVQAP